MHQEDIHDKFWCIPFDAYMQTQVLVQMLTSWTRIVNNYKTAWNDDVFLYSPNKSKLQFLFMHKMSDGWTHLEYWYVIELVSICLLIPSYNTDSSLTIYQKCCSNIGHWLTWLNTPWYIRYCLSFLKCVLVLAFYLLLIALK